MGLRHEQAFNSGYKHTRPGVNTMTPLKHKIIQAALDMDPDEATGYIPDMDTIRTAGHVLKAIGSLVGISASPKRGNKLSRAYHRGDPRDARQQKHADFWGPSSSKKGTVPIWQAGKPPLKSPFDKSPSRIHRMRAGATAPYYLSDRGKSQWHKNRAEHGSRAAIYAGVGGYVAKQPMYRNVARQAIQQKFGVDIPSEHINKAGSFMYAGAVASGAYAGYHGVKAHQYKKLYTNREREAAIKKADKGLHGDFYYRHQGGKQIKVRKGKRK